ncbi:MAG: hypothetical protein AAGF11_18050 [Myxococcota bacterium]
MLFKDSSLLAYSGDDARFLSWVGSGDSPADASPSMQYSSHTSSSKLPQSDGVGAWTVQACQPLCQTARVPSMK